MSCLSTVRYSVIVNGQSKGSIIPSRGLRQGCPLSPYLFLLCAEGFSSMLTRAERDDRLRGFACSRTSPRVSHLFFANDSLIFCRASRGDCLSILSILTEYEKVSGQ